MRITGGLILWSVLTLALFRPLTAQVPYYDQTRDGFLVFHPIQTDAQGHIVSWISEDPGEAFDFVVNAVWHFWDGMRKDKNGLP